MFSCRACSNSPFGSWLSNDDSKNQRGAVRTLSTFAENSSSLPSYRKENNVTKSQKRKSQDKPPPKKGKKKNSLPVNASKGKAGKNSSPVSSDEASVIVRREPAPWPSDSKTADAVKAKVAMWLGYAQPRARNYFQSQDAVVAILTEIAKNIKADDDPILGSSECVHWYGEKNPIDGVASVTYTLPDKGTTQHSHVNRILIFFFGDDETFEIVKSMEEPLEMECEDPLCVNMTHIIINEYEENDDGDDGTTIVSEV